MPGPLGSGYQIVFFSAVKAPVAAPQLLLTILDLDLEFDLEFDLDLDLDLDLDNRQSTPQLSQSRATIEALIAVARLCTPVRCLV